MRGRAITMLGCLTLAAARCGADWPQFRHDSARTGYVEEAVQPPLELRWRFVDVPDPDPRDLCSDEDEYFLQPLGPRVQAWPEQGVRVVPGLLATPEGVILARGWAPTTCLNSETGDVRWGIDPAWTLVSAGDGLVFFKRVIEARGARVRPNVVGAARLDTAEWAWTRDGDGEVAFVVECASPLGPDGGVLAVEACEPHRVPFRVADDGTPTSWTTDFEPLTCFLDAQSGHLIGEWSQRVDGIDPPFRESGCHVGKGAALLGDRILLAQGCLEFRTQDPLCGVWMLRGDGVGTVTPPDASAAQWCGLNWSAVSEELGLALAFEVRPQPHHLTARNLDTGEFVWTQPLLAGHSTVFPPVIDPSGVYLGLADGYVYCLDWRTGEARWRTQVGDALPRSRVWDPASVCSPICSLSGNVLWVVYRGKLLALDAATGEIRWETDETEAAWYEPVISDGWIYLLTCRGVEAWGPPPEDA